MPTILESLLFEIGIDTKKLSGEAAAKDEVVAEIIRKNPRSAGFIFHLPGGRDFFQR